MLTIPLQTISAQTLRVVLGGQNCQINIYEKPEGVFVDINANDTDIVICVLALDGVPIICREYVGFEGNLIFVDTQGTNDPTFIGFGTRYQLIYLEASEYVHFISK